MKLRFFILLTLGFMTAFLGDFSSGVAEGSQGSVSDPVAAFGGPDAVPANLSVPREGASPEVAAPGNQAVSGDSGNVVYRTPASCREFSAYMDTRAAKLDELEREIRGKQKLLEELTAQFEDLTGRYALAEERVRKLVQRDPNDLTNNPELAKMIKLYESLDPGDAASRLKDLDLDLTLALLKGMKPKKLSEIMTALEPRLAAALSSQLVRGF